MLKAVTNLVNVSQITGVLPVVNGGTGVTTSTGTGNVVLSAAPTRSGNVSLSTGNLIMSTSGKGIDFSATSGAGTSELFADYEEGTWTPVITASSGTLTSYSITRAVYTKSGRLVVATTRFTITNAGTGIANLIITLPFTAGAQDSTGAAFETVLTGDMGRAWVSSGSPEMLVARYNNTTFCVTNSSVTATAIYSV